MSKRKEYELSFKLKVIKEHFCGSSIGAVALKWGLSTSGLRRWVDHYRLSGSSGLLPKTYQYHSSSLKLKVVKGYLEEGLSLRDCCLQYAIANESMVSSWVSRYELSGIDGLREQRGRPRSVMKKEKPTKAVKPLTRLEELEKENLYLRAENELLKKLEALTQAQQTPKKKR